MRIKLIMNIGTKLIGKLRKRFNIPTKEQRDLIISDSKKIISMAYKRANTLNSKEREKETQRNNKCPNCKGVDNIVNKIQNVEGQGSVSGSLFYIEGKSSTSTKGVNHCNNCGNQWKKYEREYYSDDSVIADWFNDIASEYSSRDKTIKALKSNNILAESLWYIYKNKSSIEYDCYYSTQEKISLPFLRKEFKSIYDT